MQQRERLERRGEARPVRAPAEALPRRVPANRDAVCARVGRARAWAGELLHIKPILTIEDGEVIPVKRVRGNRKAFLEFASAFEADTSDGPQLRVGIAHADAPEKAEALRALVGRTRPAAVIELVTSLGPVVGAHAGPGTVGFFLFHDEESRGAS